MEQHNLFEQDLIGLSSEEASVWNIIKNHKGKENAVKVDTVALYTGLKDKEVREIVSGLVRQHSKLIASSTANPPGFYVITDEQELKAHIRSLRHRGIMCLVRAAALSNTSIEEIFGQGKFEYEQNQDSV